MSGTTWLQRVLAAAPVLLAISLLTFVLGGLAPGDPAEVALRRGGGEPTPEAVSELRARWGLDEPAPWRYLAWLGRALRGDLGHSYRNGAAVAAELGARLGASLALAGAALGLAGLIGLPVGVLAAVWRGSPGDLATRGLALLGAALPSYWLGLLLIYLFAVHLNWLPSGGSASVAHLVLPATALALRPAAGLARLVRNGLLDELAREYVLAARGRGLRHRAVVEHALRNALLPVVTYAGLSFGRLLGGVALVETVFGWPGLGRLVVEAAFDRDTPLIQGFVLLSGLVFIGANLVVDLSYRWFDPRVRLGGIA